MCLVVTGDDEVSRKGLSVSLRYRQVQEAGGKNGIDI